MKKLYIILLCFFIMILFSGCNKISIKFNKKPTNSYYSEELKGNFNSYGIDNVTAFEVNYSKEIPVDENDAEIINKFISSIDNTAYILKPSDLPEKSKYKLFITFNNNKKYVIDVFNEKFVAVYPWDGNYSPDYIDMTDVHTLYNLYGLCKYLFPQF